jgi:galactose mutarotase-like enzyme
MSMLDNHYADPPAEMWLRQSHAMAGFTPSEGCWCTAFRVRSDDEWFAILAEPPSWEALRTRPTMYGNPLLFPYPYWVRDATFEYRGRVYHLPPGRELGRAIHGIVRDHAWTVERIWEDRDGAHLEASFSHGGELLAEYPFPFVMVATHTLAGTTLTDHWRVTNLGDGPMPMGLGIHPYFSLPLFPGGQVSDLTMRSDVAFTLPVMGGGRYGPAEGVLDMRPGQRVDEYMRAAAPAERSLLVLYAQRDAEIAAPSEGWSGASWRLTDTALGLEIAVETSGAFGYVANFSPPSRAVLSPVLSTCLPGALNLIGQGVHSGIIELAPGETWEAQARISARWTS